MASDYGLNFGFRRSDESVAVREGRYKTPATGSALLLGTVVTIDNSNPGYLKQAGASAPVLPGVTGILVQEEIWDRSIYDAQRVDSFGLGIAKPNRLAAIWTGAGVKFWLKNTGASDRADGRHINAVTLFTATSVAAGHGLAWDGTYWVNVTSPTDATAIATVLSYDSTNGYLEAVLNR